MADVCVSNNVHDVKAYFIAYSKSISTIKNELNKINSYLNGPIQFVGRLTNLMNSVVNVVQK